MKLASPRVPVLIRYVARHCLRGTLLDLSRENETWQPARVKHRRSPRLRCRSRFACKMRLHLAFAHVRPTLGRPHLLSVPKRCCSLRQHQARNSASCPARNLGCEPGAGAWRNPTIPSAFALFSHWLTAPLLIPGPQLTLSASTLVETLPRLSFRRPAFHSCGSCSCFIPPVSLVEQTRRWSVALKTSGTDDEADQRSRHAGSSAHNTQTRDDTRKRSKEALRPPPPGWK
jgi:hypothetical protein